MEPIADAETHPLIGELLWLDPRLRDTRATRPWPDVAATGCLDDIERGLG
jgi:hypothetical protein